MKRLLLMGFLVSCCGTNKGVIKRGGHYDADIKSNDCIMHDLHQVDSGNMPRKICISDSDDVIQKLKNNYYLDRNLTYRIEKAETDVWIFDDQVPVIILERL